MGLSHSQGTGSTDPPTHNPGDRMDILKWIRPAPRVETVVQHVVDPHMGQRQLVAIMKHVDQTKYQVGDSIESVAYRQGQIDLANFINKQIIGGKL